MFIAHTNRLAAALVAALLLVAAAAPTAAAAGQAISKEKETVLLGVLRSDAPKGEKALACKLLAVDGSGESVAELAKLLPDEELSSWARIALEAIPGPEADEALRQATESLQGKLLVGTINSIGVRRDPQAVDTLVKRLGDAEVDVAAASAVALGHIGGANAAKALRAALTSGPVLVRSAAAEGCVLCAEQFAQAGNVAEAIAIYDEVRSANVSQPRVLEATRGAILVRKDAGIPLLLETLRSPDKHLFRLALSTAREMSGDEIDQALAHELASSPPELAALIVVAMADRPKTVVLPAIVEAAGQAQHGEVRLAAVESLGRVGDATCLGVLLTAAVADNARLSTAAKNALAELRGDQVDVRIIEMLAKAEGQEYPMLIGLVGQRRLEATPVLLKGLEHSDQAVRAAALAALGETVRQNDLKVLIAQAVSPKHAEDAAAAQQALKAASVRMPDREACAAALVAALREASSTPTKGTLLEILAAVGGKNALQGVGDAAKTGDADLQDVSSRLLGSWATEDVAPVLLDLATTSTSDKIRARALRGYLRIPRQFVLPDAQRLEMCQKAFAVAKQNAERKLVLEVLQRYPSLDGLKLAIKAMEISELKNDAGTATLVIAHKLGSQEGGVPELLASAGFDKVNVEIVKAEYGDESTKKDVSAVLRKQITELPLIVLDGTYNKSLGGDPAPGKVKQLKVQYKINGKSGEAVFAENDAIILPIPE